jgi:iron complex outermembrane receptor protein
VRGMQLDWQSAFKIDGMPFNSYGVTMPYEQLEKVELLKGLTGSCTASARRAAWSTT